MKSLRHDADDRVAFAERDSSGESIAVEGQRPADRIGTAGEIPLPRMVAEHDDVRALTFVGLVEPSAEQRRDAEHLKCPGRYGNDRLAHAVRTSGDRDEGDAVRREVREGARAGAELEEFSDVHAFIPERTMLGRFGGGDILVRKDQPIRARKRQRAQQDGVDDAEDGGVGADAERERQDGDAGEAGIARE